MSSSARPQPTSSTVEVAFTLSANGSELRPVQPPPPTIHAVPLPQVAIIGRPNVGKSSLMNRFARRRVSIVDPTPGVTRDRVTTIIELDPPADAEAGAAPILVEIVDTGGFGVYAPEDGARDDAGEDLSSLAPSIEAQIDAARGEADVILFVTDAQAGVTVLDERVARLLRDHGDEGRVISVANKVDGAEWTAHGLEAARFGLGAPVCVSAASGHGMRGLLDELYRRFADRPALPPEVEPVMKLAIVGTRNAGKSTLVNALAGEERVIVSEIPGTTRDAIDVRFEHEGRAMIAIDTAGVRKRKSFADDVEFYAYHRMLAAIRRADVALLLIDATKEVSQIDKRLSLELERQYKPTIIVVTKCDQLDERAVSPEDYAEYLTKELHGIDYAPIVFVSAPRGEGIEELVLMAWNLHQQAGHREPTAEVNRVVEGILAQRGPSSRLGTQAKLYYASQIDVHPPTIVLKVNRPDLFHGHYERYILNRLREALPFSEVPIRLIFTARDRKSLSEMKERGRARALEKDRPPSGPRVA
jgi:GTP-binding protein